MFGSVVISGEVYAEVVVSGAGLAGAAETSKSAWIEVRQIKQPADLTVAQSRFGLGAGELSTIILAKELHADLVILDDLGARKLAKKEGLKVQGIVGLLEGALQKGHIGDLRLIYEQLLKSGSYLDRTLLNTSLSSLDFKPL